VPAEARPRRLRRPHEISGICTGGKNPAAGRDRHRVQFAHRQEIFRGHQRQWHLTFTGLPRGRYVVRIEFMGSAPQTQESCAEPERLLANSTLR